MVTHIFRMVAFILLAVVILIVIIAIIGKFFFGVKVMSSVCKVGAYIIATFINPTGHLAGLTAQIMGAPCDLLPV
jgi:membrane protein YdbS with pleckstrin-like domain